MLSIPYKTQAICPILNKAEVEYFSEQNQIIRSHLTLPEILNLALESGENNPKYHQFWLQCLYASS
ncbi:hypothetical protein [Fischerella sp. PCC 9605]|uniref:hypothetical protein n=1 Tax=Fischerella sp. PCC 9605 TaxID=1173024 RepID=UPI00047A7A50|nr:hypothetical protein [Fischerella sp. PCC 9605]